MKILGIETSTMTGSVAILDENRLIAEHILNIKTTHSERLMPSVDGLLKSVHLTIHDIDGFAVAIGPGSFTGLRIGVSTAKGLAFAAKKPIVGVPTLDALAHTFSFTDYLICPLLDARKKEVYCALYRFNKGEMKKLTEDLAIPPAELIDKIKEPVIFMGDGVAIYRDLILQKLGDLAFFAPKSMNVPRAANIAELGLKELEAGRKSDTMLLVPNYVRRSEAEIIREEKERGNVKANRK